MAAPELPAQPSPRLPPPPPDPGTAASPHHITIVEPPRERLDRAPAAMGPPRALRLPPSRAAATDASQAEKGVTKRERKNSTWSIGMLQDRETDDVPGSVLILSEFSKDYDSDAVDDDDDDATTTVAATAPPSQRASGDEERSLAMFGRRAAKKTTKDGKTILEPQPDESANDPLNWSTWRRDVALVSLGIYCMLGGGMTAVLAAGLTNVAETFDVTVPRVALTTGLYLMGLGVGSVVASPTAIIFGKRPVYLTASLLFVVASVWCALSPSFASLAAARVFMGMSVSPVECLPSATIAEIFFLHQRAYRLGVYTLLLLGGKNLVPLAGAAVIQSLGWRWVFWVTAMVVGFCACLLFFFVPETFWDRSPRPHRHFHDTALARRINAAAEAVKHPGLHRSITDPVAPIQQRLREDGVAAAPDAERRPLGRSKSDFSGADSLSGVTLAGNAHKSERLGLASPPSLTPLSVNAGSVSPPPDAEKAAAAAGAAAATDNTPADPAASDDDDQKPEAPPANGYTDYYKSQPPKTFLQTLKPYSGRLTHDNWFKIAARPFILYSYPAILWSSAVYALSVGWLIILSETVASVFRNPDTYNFSALGVGLIYASPFVGGLLGTVVAGKASDFLVRALARRNNGVYEPEFRLFMAIPIALSTTVGLMGFGWSISERDNFWVPTVFFGIISFGCCMGSTVAISFAVDSYRQYAGEALVTINFSKNIFHGLVFSLFFNSWLEADGAKVVFLALGGVQLFFLLFTIPMYIYGKRARMWTVRKQFMGKLKIG